jgi:thiol-disulfide isomerase/thioredoxin
VPAFEPFGQFAWPPGVENVLYLQDVRPLPEILTFFGNRMSIFEAVEPGTLFLTNVVIFTAFGLDFLPAFFGETVVVAETSWFCAMATEASAIEASAAIAAIRNLRKSVLLLRRFRDRATRKAPGFAGAYPQVANPFQGAEVALLASARVRAPPEAIPAPPFPRNLEWVNVAPLRMDQQRGHPVLVEFWDFCRVNSLRTLPYLSAWHERYGADGLRVIGIHAGGFEPARDPAAVRAAVGRLGIEYPVVIDERLELWDFYGNEGWPARYLWDRDGALYSMHYGEGAYEETEREIQALLGVERELVPPVRAEDAPGTLLPAQTADQPGAYSGPYEAGAVWAVLDGRGEVRADGRAIAVDGPGAYALVEHPRHTRGVLDLAVGDGVTCHATCFTPGLP